MKTEIISILDICNDDLNIIAIQYPEYYAKCSEYLYKEKVERFFKYNKFQQMTTHNFKYIDNCTMRCLNCDSKIYYEENEKGILIDVEDEGIILNTCKQTQEKIIKNIIE